MTDIKQQIATQLEAYSSLDALKTAVREWVITSDGSLDALTAVLSTHHNESYNLTAARIYGAKIRQKVLISTYTS